MVDVVDPASLRTRTEFGAGLNALRESAGFTVRELAKRIGRPSGTVGDYLRGRHVPSPAQESLIVDLLTACGVTEHAEVEAWLAALRRVRASSDRRTTRSAAPYRGLKPFEPEDAALFFGRRDQTDEIVELIAGLRAARGPSRGILAVIGPSGSGKSSLLRAGVIAAVRAGALDTDPDDAGVEGVSWTCAVTTPGDNPVAAFGTALAARSAGPHLVVVDQFEEIFTLTSDSGARASFLAALADIDPDVVVALGMRADFFAAAAREPVLLAALRHAQVVVGPLNADQLHDAVVGPANHIGVSVEDGLVEVVLADLGPHHTGALPLLSHALLATWDRSTRRALTVADYRATGGLDAAVQRTAEEVFSALDAHQQEAAHDLFVRLVNVGDDVAPTRRRITRAELGLDEPDGARTEIREVVDRFAERRLLTLTADTVEVSHEALLTAWPRLRSWLDTDRAGLLVHRRVTTGANTWAAAGRDPIALPAGAGLETAVEWAAAPHNRRRLNALELAYLDAGVRRREDLAHAERRRTRRLAQLLVAVAVLALVATGLAVLARVAQNSANHERRVATAARDNALSRQVAIQARELSATDPGLAQQLAVAGYRISPTAESRSELIDAAAAPVITRVLGATGPTPLAVSVRGTVAVGHADDGSVHLLSLPGGRPTALGVIPGTDQPLFALAFSPDGQLLATGGGPHEVVLWDVRDPRRPRSLSRLPTGFTGAVQSIAFAPDGRRLLAAGDGAHPLDEWQVSDPAHVAAVPAPTGLPPSSTVNSIAFDRAGTSVAAVTLAGDVLEWSTARPDLPRQADLPARSLVRLNAVAFSPLSGQLLTGGASGVTIWDVGPQRLSPVRVVPGSSDGRVSALAFSGDGTQLLAGNSDDTVLRWDTRTWDLLATTPGPGPVTGVAFSADGSSVFATTADGAVRRWAAAGTSATIGSGAVFALSFTGDGRTLAIAQNGVDGGVQLWDTSNPRALHRDGALLRMTGARTAIDGTCALSRDGRLTAAGNSSGQVELWDTRDRARPRAFGAPFAASTALIESVALNPDGTLLAVGGDDHTVALWDVRVPSRPTRLSVLHTGNLVLNVAFSPDGRLLAAGNADHTARLWDVSDPAAPRADAVLHGGSPYVWGVAFSPDGRLFATAGADRVTRLWSLADPEHPVRVGAPLRGPTDYDEIPTFDASGHLLAVPSNDHTVWVYDVSHPARTRVLATLRAVQGNVFAAAFDPVGRRLVAGGRFTTVPVWTIDPDADAALICSGAGTPITRTEWRQYVPGAPYDPPCR